MATAQRKQNALALPDDVVVTLAAEDKRKGFAPGTMQSLMAQEIGGQESTYLKDIQAYHYALNAQGKRIAKHTGKESTAFGPFGLLESTAKDPGYGVKPLGDKTSFAEQARFAADYLGARGLAGYGEGKPYSDQVIARRDGAKVPTPVKAPVVVAEATPQVAPAPAVMASVTPIADAVPTPVAAAVPVQAAMTPEADAWQEFLARSRIANAPAPVVAQAPVYKPLQLQVPDFLSMVGYMNKDRTPTGFQAFTGMDPSV